MKPRVNAKSIIRIITTIIMHSLHSTK